MLVRQAPQPTVIPLTELALDMPRLLKCLRDAPVRIIASTALGQGAAACLTKPTSVTPT